jgi:hypothetical protein
VIVIAQPITVPLRKKETRKFMLQVVEDYRKKIDVTKKSGLSV